MAAPGGFSGNRTKGQNKVARQRAEQKKMNAAKRARGRRQERHPFPTVKKSS